MPTTVSDETVVDFLEMLMDAFEAKIVPVVQNQDQPGLEHAAQRIANCVMGTMRQHPDTLRPSQVEVALTANIGGLDQPSVRCTSRSNPQDEAIFVALGSNVGDRIANIEIALQSIDNSSEIQLLKTSPLYETKPMYVEDQEPFLNGVCKVSTDCRIVLVTAPTSVHPKRTNVY